MKDKYCAVAPDGERVVIPLPEKFGNPKEISLTFDEASALGMTLPRLLTEALRRRFSDKRLRHVYPVKNYRVECVADNRHLLLTLSCDDGFDIVFAVDVRMIKSLVRDLELGQTLIETPQVPLQN